MADSIMISDIVPVYQQKKKKKIVLLLYSPAKENLGLNPPPSLNLRKKKRVKWSHVPIIKRDNNNNNIKGKKDGLCY